ncbi:MAG: hypothetical protein JXR37_09740 [Kiritimatiellae bacterium]|nr:hypothetical protein [Kiritimatiellia bacterium]
MKRLVPVWLCLVVCFLMAAYGASALERWTLIKLYDLDKDFAFELLGSEELGALEKLIAAENRVFPQAGRLAEEAWGKSHKDRFPKGHLAPRRIQTAKTFSDQAQGRQEMLDEQAKKDRRDNRKTDAGDKNKKGKKNQKDKKQQNKKQERMDEKEAMTAEAKALLREKIDELLAQDPETAKLLPGKQAPAEEKDKQESKGQKKKQGQARKKKEPKKDEGVQDAGAQDAGAQDDGP